MRSAAEHARPRPSLPRLRCNHGTEVPAPTRPAAVDFGVAQLQQHMRDGFRFPWLLSNVLDARTGEPLGGAERSRLLDWQGVRVGLMGLVEREVRPLPPSH